MNELNLFTLRAPYGKCHIFGKIKWRLKCLKWGIQRIKRGYSDYDLWDLSEFYLNLFTDSLNGFVAKEPLGVPDEFYNPEIKGEGSIEWKNYILKMASEFEEAKLRDNKSFEENKKHLCNGLEMLGAHFYGIWD